MPLSIVFNQDPESHSPIHEGMLFERMYQPANKIWEEAKKRNLDYITLLHSDDAVRTRFNLVPPKPLIFWMYEFMSEVEAANNNEKFHFEFSYYRVSFASDDGDEYVGYSSCPMWFVTIRDFERVKVHKSWTIAFDDWADIRIKRGPATSADPMYNASREDKKMKMKLFSVIKEHVRLRNFRIERLKKAL